MRYHVDNRFGGSSVQQALAAGFKTGLTLFNGSGGTSPGGRLAGIAVGLDGSPNAATDTQTIFIVQRMTADGTGTLSGTNTLKNTWNATASRNTCKTNYTAEPTYTSASNIWLRAFNQRAAMQWNMFDVDSGPEWQSIQPASAGSVPNGIGVVASGGAAPVTSNFSTAAEFDE